MNTPVNGFKQSLAARRVQIGLWLGLADPYCAEICAGAGFDWLALDAEHGPNTIRTLLVAAAGRGVVPGAHDGAGRASGDPAHLKQLLDIGAQTLVVPLVESAEQARAVVRATRYPPDGIRGVGSALARASRWNRHVDYLKRADAEVCLIVQVESVGRACESRSNRARRRRRRRLPRARRPRRVAGTSGRARASRSFAKRSSAPSRA